MEEDFVEESDEDLEGLLSNSDEESENNESSNDSDTFVRKRKVPFAKRQQQQKQKEQKKEKKQIITTKETERTELGLRSRRHVNYCEETYEDILNPTIPLEKKAGLCFFFVFLLNYLLIILILKIIFSSR